MSFIAPLFFVALAALAIPVLIHLIQREKKQILRFPSLMFVQRVPYKSIQRRRIHNWLLLLVRLAALALIVLAFARPFFTRQSAPLPRAPAPARWSCCWTRATAWGTAITGSARAPRPPRRSTVSGRPIAARSSCSPRARRSRCARWRASERGQLAAAVAAAKPTAGATRYAPALKVAGSILAESPLPRREVVLVSDFQRSGWRGEEGARLPGSSTVTPAPITGGTEAPNVAVTAVSLARSTFSGQERVEVTAVVVNRGTRSLSGGQLALEIGGRPLESKPLSVEAGSSASVTFAPFTVAASYMRGTVRAGADALLADNAFNFVVSPAEPVRVVVVDRGGAGSAASVPFARARDW